MATSPTYNDCLAAMYGLRRFGIKLGLDVIGNMLAGLENPQTRYRTVHVAGSNGKGSIATFVAAILSAAGYRVGVYTSPHLVRFNERITVDGRQISDADVVDTYRAVNRVHHGDREPTFFEYTTAMALLHFARESVDWAVIETGMGGRLDATNIIRPAVSIISNISLEHQMYLGNTIAQIAGEKGGIIKPGIPVVTGARQASARQVLAGIARDNNAVYCQLGHDFKRRRTRPGTFSYSGTTWRLNGLKTGLRGDHQLDNAAIAVAACEAINRSSAETSARIDETAVRIGLEQARWPGRLEIVSESPTVILDGAHNPAAIRNLAAFLSTELRGRRLFLVTGMLDDKAYAPMLSAILPICRRVFLTRPKIDRSLAPERLLPLAKTFDPDATVIHDVGEAVTAAIAAARPEDVVCIAGSLYVVGEAKEFLETGAIRSTERI